MGGHETNKPDIIQRGFIMVSFSSYYSSWSAIENWINWPGSGHEHTWLTHSTVSEWWRLSASDWTQQGIAKLSETAKLFTIISDKKCIELDKVAHMYVASGDHCNEDAGGIERLCLATKMQRPVITSPATSSARSVRTSTPSIPLLTDPREGAQG